MTTDRISFVQLLMGGLNFHARTVPVDLSPIERERLMLEAEARRDAEAYARVLGRPILTGPKPKNPRRRIGY